MRPTDAELVDALARRRLGLPPPLPFTVHELGSLFLYGTSNPSKLYERFGDRAGPDGCVYFFCDQIGACDRGWKVASGNERVVAGGKDVGCKVTLVFDDSRWGIQQGTMQWIMDEFDAVLDHRQGKITRDLYDLCLYRLRRQQGPPRQQQEARRVGGFRRLRLVGNN